MAAHQSVAMCSKIKNFYEANRTSLLTIFGVISGLLCGQLVKWLVWSDGQPVDPYLLRYISLPGIIYIRAFLLLIVPLLFSSLSTCLLYSENVSASNEEIKSKEIDPKKLLAITLVFFVSFTVFASAVGIGLATILRPGSISSGAISSHAHLDQLDQVNITKIKIEQANSRSDSILNIILNIFPENIISLMFSTSFVQTKTVWPSNLTKIVEPNYVPELKQQTVHSNKPNMIGVCVVAFLLGLLLKKLGPEKTKIIREFLKEIDHLVHESFGFLLTYMPLGMFLWMFSEALKMHSITNVAFQLIYFYIILFGGFVFLLFVFYPLVYFIIIRENPFLLYQTIVPAILVALGTASSVITFPMTLKCMERKLSKPIAQTVLPLGMNLNMNGSAMYYPMVALFVAQIKQVHVDPVMLGVLWLFSLLMCMGLPGAPAGGLVLINHIAFASVIGIDNPQDVLAFIMSFEWIWDRIRTSINIIGDCFVAKCVDKLTENDQLKQDECTHL